MSPRFATDRTVFIARNYYGLFKSTDGGDNWSSYPVYLSNVLFSPDYATDNTLFGVFYGGLYRSTDNGGTWQQVTTGLGANSVSSLAVSPTYSTDHTLYALTSNGIYLSTDDGRNIWSSASVSGWPNGRVSSLVFSPNFATDRTLMASINRSLYLSTDGGTNWYTPAGGFSDFIYALLPSPDFATDHTLYVGAGNGLFTVVNSDGNWSVSNWGLGRNSIGNIVLSPAFVTDHTLFAQAGIGGVYRSVDGGTSWQLIINGLSNLSVSALVVSPDFPSDHTLVVGTNGGVFISSDGGNNWRASNTGLTSNANLLAISPTFATDLTLFAGTTSGIFKSTDAGATWAPASSGLETLNVNKLTISPAFASDRTLIAGIYNGLAISTNAGESWARMGSASFFYDADPIAFSPAYASDREIFGWHSGRVRRSIDGGNSWSVVSLIMDIAVSSIAVSPNYAVDHTLMISSNILSMNNPPVVYLSTDRGANWSILSEGLSTGVNVAAFSPVYATDRTLFAGAKHGVWQNTLSPIAMSSVITYPANNSYFSDASVTITGSANETGGYGYGIQKVEISTDNGATWQLASGTSNWSYVWSPATGRYKIKVRAINNAGMTEQKAMSDYAFITIDRAKPTGEIRYDYNLDLYSLWALANDPMPPGMSVCQRGEDDMGQCYYDWLEMLLPGSSVWQAATNFSTNLPYGTVGV